MPKLPPQPEASTSTAQNDDTSSNQQQYSYTDNEVLNTANMHEAPVSAPTPTTDHIAFDENTTDDNADAVDLDEQIAKLEREFNELSEKSDETVHAATKTFEMEIKQTQEVDERSIYVGSVDYSTTAEELRDLFADCGDVNRITIPANKHTLHPKGFAYVEFKEKESVSNAVAKNGTPFKGRALIVTQKRTNLPGMKEGGAHRGGFRGGFRGGGYRGGPPRGGYRGGGYAPRGRGRGGYGGRGAYSGGYAPRGGYRGRGQAPYHYQPY